jgi:hypothetical protein
MQGGSHLPHHEDGATGQTTGLLLVPQDDERVWHGDGLLDDNHNQFMANGCRFHLYVLVEV